MLKVDKVFVLHVKKGYEDRKSSIVEQFEKLGIDFEFILDGDISDFTEEIKNKYFNESMHHSKTGMSCALKHIYAHEKIIENDYRNALIFEDDVILDSRFEYVFNKCMDELKDIHSDICIYYSNASNMYVPKRQIKKDVYLYKAKEVRAADSYSISRKVAQKRLDFVKKNKYSHPADHQYNYMDPQIDVEFYWCHPTVAEQGSMNGLFDSGISLHRKKSLFRSFRWKFDKLYKKNIRTLFK